MSLVYTAAEISELALGFCSVLTPYDMAANPEEFDTALKHFNLLLAEKVGTKKYWWWVPAEQVIPLQAGVSEYDLDLLLATAGTPLSFVKDAFLRQNGKDCPIDLIRQWQFDQDYQETKYGTPDRVYVTRGNAPTVYVLNTPPTDLAAGDMYLVLRGIRYPDDLEDENGAGNIPFPTAWARWMALSTALDIGAGPVVVLPSSHYSRLEKAQLRAERRLNAFNNRENLNTTNSGFTRFREF